MGGSEPDFWPVLGEPGRARPSQPIDHSIGKTGMPEMVVQNGQKPRNPEAKVF